MPSEQRIQQNLPNMYQTPRKSSEQMLLESQMQMMIPGTPKRRREVLVVQRLPSDLAIPNLDPLSGHDTQATPQLKLSMRPQPVLFEDMDRIATPPLREESSRRFISSQHQPLPLLSERFLRSFESPVQFASSQPNDPDCLPSRKRARRHNSTLPPPRRLTSSFAAATSCSVRVPRPRRPARVESCQW